MPYIKGNGASSRYGIMGVPGHQPGPDNNWRTAEEAHAESVERAQANQKVSIAEFDAVAHTLRTANAMAQTAATDREAQQSYGQHCRYIEAQIAEISSALQQHKEYGHGCVIVPVQTWQQMTALSEWCIPVLQALKQIMQPVKLVIQNGQSLEDAQRIGSYDEVRR